VNILRQIERGSIVSPRTLERLCFSADGRFLATEGGESFPVIRNGDTVIPVLLLDPVWADRYVKSSEKMSREYSCETGRFGLREAARRRFGTFLRKDYRNRKIHLHFSRMFDPLDTGQSLVLSIGGGPARQHPVFTNLNIGPFPNVDVVADAHHLPYAQCSVDAIFCEAVLEHLAEPQRAVQEMFRVLKGNGKVLSITPFLQTYHGYPDHFQNFTLTGHEHLYRKAGFSIVDSGTCVGPVYAFFDLNSRFFREFFHPLVHVPARILLKLLGLMLKSLDRGFHERGNAMVFASTTFVLAEKEG
jgi:SAM-dependent methyltransferase